MKRMVKGRSDSKVKKKKLKEQFGYLCSELKAISNLEFVYLLKNDQIQLAQEWIQDLTDLLDKFRDEADLHIPEYVIKLLIDNHFVGYVSRYIKQSKSCVITITPDRPLAMEFFSIKEAEHDILDKCTTCEIHEGSTLHYYGDRWPDIPFYSEAEMMNHISLEYEEV